MRIKRLIIVGGGLMALAACSDPLRPVAGEPAYYVATEDGFLPIDSVITPKNKLDQ